MSAPTLDDILAPPTPTEAMNGQVLPELRAPRDGVALPVRDWKVGGPFRSLAWIVASLYSQARTYVAGFAAATFGDYAFGFVDPPSGLDGVTAWATSHARDRYGVTRIAATRTTRTIRIVNALATAHNVAAGSMIIQFTSTGNRYRNAEAYVSAGSDTVDVLFESEFPVDSTNDLDYQDSSGATIQLITAQFSGLTLTNPATTYSDVAQVGAGTGTVTPSGTPGGAYSVSVRIDVSGQAAACTWSWRVDTGAWTQVVATASAANIDGSGITVTLSNGAGTPAFIAGSTYFFNAPGSDVVTVGRDEETPQELGTRCRAVLPLLNLVKDSSGNWIPISPTASGYEALARSASDQVKVCLVRTSSTVNNKVHVIVSGQGSILSASTVALLQDYFDAYTMLTDSVEVASPSEESIAIAGVTVTVKQAQLTSAQQEIQRKLAAYLSGVDPNAALPPAGLIERGYVIGLIRMTPGVTNVTEATLTIEGATADYQLAADTIATWSQSVASAFTWVTV